MIRFLKILLVLLIVCLLTMITQVGGIVFLVTLLSFRLIDKKLHQRWVRSTVKILSFAGLYLLSVFLIVPLLAKPFGRVPLPISETRHLKPANVWTCLLNRNYVRAPLREIAMNVAEQMHAKYPGSTINYLDANFPFIDKFPLLPHLSHSDGKKLDISLPYRNSSSGEITNEVPSFIGYGICEGPRPGEENIPAYCAGKGFWQYNLLPAIVSQKNKAVFAFDGSRTREMVNFFAAHGDVGKIFIEPHLKTRLGLTTPKIRFHGCQAVRHDDHIHVQLR